MKNKIIKEIHRINNLIGNENILSEQIVPKMLKKLFGVLDDDVARKVLKSTDSSQDDLIRRLKAGETLSDDAMELLLRVIDYDLLAKTLVDQKILGDRLNANIDKIINVLNDNPGRYDELTKRMDDAIETMGVDNEFPDELISAVKKDIKGRIDNGIGNTFKDVDDIDIDVKKPKTDIEKVFLSDDEIDKLNKIVEAKTVKTFAYDIVRYWKSSIEDIMEEIQGLSEGFIESTKGLKNKEKKELRNAYGAQISRLLDRAEIKQNGAAAEILEKAGVSQELVTKIRNAKEPFFEVYRRARGIDNETLSQIMRQTAKEFVVEIWDLIKGLFRKEGNTLIRLFDPKTSVGQWFITNQWASLNKLYRLAIKMSPGQNRAKLLRFIGASMFASSIGFVIGQLLKSGLQGLNDVYGVGLRNSLIDLFGGDDGMIFGYDVGQYKKDLPEYGAATDLLGELGKPLDAVGQRIFDDVIKSYNENGFKDLLLRTVPGGVLTYPESLLVQVFENVTPGEGNVPNLRDFILEKLGFDPKEVEDELKKLEGEGNTIPEDLIEVFPDSKLESLKIDGNGNYYWGDPENKIEKNPTTNQWEVLIPGSGWYVIDKEM